MHTLFHHINIYGEGESTLWFLKPKKKVNEYFKDIPHRENR